PYIRDRSPVDQNDVVDDLAVHAGRRAPCSPFAGRFAGHGIGRWAHASCARRRRVVKWRAVLRVVCAGLFGVVLTIGCETRSEASRAGAPAMVDEASAGSGDALAREKRPA